MGKRYLIRAGYNPLVQYDFDDVLFNNISGANSGNQLYAYGVFNVLFDGENEIVSTYYKNNFTENEIDYINNNFDAFILPLADAFRNDYQNNLIIYTNLIEKLKIPCVVIGACVRAPYDGKLNEGFPFDETVKKFVSAVLDKSAVIGLRGNRTGEYLNYLGFIEDKHYKAIGCPSLYTYGDDITTKDPPKQISKLVLNINPNVSEHVNRFFRSSYRKTVDTVMILQESIEFEPLYYGYRIKKWPSREFPYSEVKKFCRNGSVKFFFDPMQWYEFVSSYDISLGTRFHGTVANILSGIPHIIIPLDSRMQELVEFHHITHINIDEVRGDITNYLDRLDFHSFENNQPENLKKYKLFLKDNGIQSVFDKDVYLGRGNSPLEKLRVTNTSDFCSYSNSGLKEKFNRRVKLASHIINRKYLKRDYFSFGIESN